MDETAAIYIVKAPADMYCDDMHISEECQQQTGRDAPFCFAVLGLRSGEVLGVCGLDASTFTSALKNGDAILAWDVVARGVTHEK